ncbi:MAG: hypothetical protein HYX80_10000 [Chloroflexi bacterium]|nr:hypothetical protein [Chloroflexota bacterium]
MKLGSFIEGSQALAQVNQLHGTTIDLSSAYIAEYSHDFNPYHNDRARVTVWVGTARSNDAAAALLSRMVAGISTGNTPFSKPERVTVAGLDIYQVTGSGGDHFFYQSRESPDRVVWLTIEEAGDAVSSIVEQAVDEF